MASSTRTNDRNRLSGRPVDRAARLIARVSSRHRQGDKNNCHPLTAADVATLQSTPRERGGPQQERADAGAKFVLQRGPRHPEGPGI